ncbi:MAG TPA: hypothetical protein VFN35_05935, partial [Ktedonobacteraceae bacterium]|nr:hypothetical protein [Ktedonobacteraceae bacterium]
MSEKEADEAWLPAEALALVMSVQRLESLRDASAWRLMVASHPAAPTALLECLAQDQGEQVRQAVAGNPNTPWHILEHLAPEFPRAFLHNPVGPVQILAHPEQISRDETLWMALLREAPIPAHWWNWLLNSPPLSASQTIHLHVQYAGETSDMYGVLQQGEEEALLTLVDILTSACVQGVTLPALTDNPQVNLSTLSCEQLIRDHLRELAFCGEKRVRVAALANPLVPVDVLSILALDPNQHEGVRWTVAEHTLMPVEVLRTLALDKDEWVRYLVASHE